MDISLILRAAGIGLIVSVVCQILNKSGRDEQAMLLTAGEKYVLWMDVTWRDKDITELMVIE